MIFNANETSIAQETWESLQLIFPDRPPSFTRGEMGRVEVVWLSPDETYEQFVITVQDNDFYGRDLYAFNEMLEDHTNGEESE